ncbi:GNAT family N-acetyltransferase [Parasphingorhabdus pacifica]
MTRGSVRTERLVLRPFDESDVDDVFALHNDPAVMRFINGGRPVERSEVHDRTFPAFLEYDRKDSGYGYWAAESSTTGGFLGWFELVPRASDVELGYRLRASAWGRGYATEGARALLDLAFGELGARRVVATAMAVNAASRRVMEKLGMVHVATVHRLWPEAVEGSEHGDVEYAVTADAHARTA